MRSARRVLLVYVSLPAAPLGAVSAQLVRDSAGIQVVTNQRPLLPAARGWRIEPRPTLTIGGDE